MASPTTLEELQAAGIYDPGAPGAEDHAFMLGQLIERGAGLEEIRAAYHRGALASLLLELRLTSGARLRFSELAERAGVDEDFLRLVWRAAGFREPASEDRRFSTEDAEVLSRMSTARLLLGDEPVLDVIRAVGIGLAQAAEASVAGLRTRLDEPARPMLDGDTDRAMLHEWLEHDWSQIEATIGMLFRQHSIDASRRYLEWHARPNPQNIVDVVVGFVDLVGSTAVAERDDLQGFDEVIRRFESIAAGIIVDSGALLVKLIGDAAMFVSFAPGVACEVALQLAEAFADDPVVPPCKVGMAAGPAIAQRGDYFGPVVNLASRAAGVAAESAVLVSASLRTRVVGVTDTYSFRRVPVAQLAGIDRRVILWELRR